MRYSIYFLQFDTPLHFGCGEVGGKLESGSLTYRADTLFGALCCELASYGDQQGLERIHSLAQEGKLLLSDLFPYVMEDGGEGDLELYLPKPIYEEKEQGQTTELSFGEMKRQSTRQKQMKKLEYVRVSQLRDFLQDQSAKQSLQWQRPLCSENQVVTRVNCQGEVPRPYYVQEEVLPEHCGLYGILAYETEEDKDWLLQLLEQLGLSGIGGKRSSGFGKFHFEEDGIDLEDPIFTDDEILYGLLTDQQVTCYMSLSALLPRQEEIATVKKGTFKLVKRSGFVTPDGDPVQKKQDIYMVEAGSCFPTKLSGSIADVSWRSSHPVWRYGKGLFVGLK